MCDQTGIRRIHLDCRPDTLKCTLLDSVLNLFGWDYAKLEEQIRAVPAGCDGLLLLPYLTGERTIRGLSLPIRRS
jgi:hypothetical protein